MTTSNDTDAFLQRVKQRSPNETEFHQAVEELVESVMPFYLDHDTYQSANILDRLVEPDRIVSFRVAWEDDNGNVVVNRGFRVQFNQSLGPYKGGLRFHPSVNQSVLKFLGFEQIFKNALTGLPMGGGKGGSDFNPKGRSDREVMRFCQAFMTELSRHIGASVDVPAGDIGVGGREIGYMFGQFLRLQNRWEGVLTGKGKDWGGSKIRTEATGYGCVKFCQLVLEQNDQSLDGKKIAISGSGNVAIYAAERAIELGANVVSLSDSGGVCEFKDGLNAEQLEFVRVLKEERRGRISEAAEAFDGATFHKGKNPWGLDVDIAMPCATQNEINADDAKLLIANGCEVVCEGANMPTTADAIHAFAQSGVRHAPGKASNAGGVSVSGLEMSQNALGIFWDADDVLNRLDTIMEGIHAQCVAYGSGTDGTDVDYIKGANIAGFKKVADAMVAHGIQ